MRRAGRTDENQQEIVTALRNAGFSVAICSSIGGGFPDLLVGKYGVNCLMEIKDGSKVPSKRKLTPDEQSWHDAWRGQVHIVQDVEQALDVATMVCRG